jgi:hypothetical protein
MAYEITQTARDLANEIQLQPNIVICFPKLGKCYAAKKLLTVARYGENGIYYGQPGLVFGGLTEIQGSGEYISLSGTTQDIVQQLEPDKAAASSTQTIVVKLADLNGDITGLISPGFVTDDLLYEFAQVYLGHSASSFPDDYIEIFNGNVTDIVSGSGFIDLSISHPDDHKRSEIFTKLERELVQKVDFNSLTVQDLFYQARPDVAGTVSIQYTNGGILGDVANVTVAGNNIYVSIDIFSTKAKTIKKAIENNDSANQLVSVKIVGNGNNVQAVYALTAFESDTEIYLDSVAEFLLPVSPIFQTYVRINDEIIQYTGINVGLNKLTGCTRQSLNSFGYPHEIGDNVTSFYKLGDGSQDYGNAINLALWIMLSGGPEYYAENIDVGNFVKVYTENITNCIFFPSKNLKQLYGVIIGDKITTVGATNLANNFVDRTITDIIIDGNGTKLIVDGASLVIEETSPATCYFKSKYNILPDGIGLDPVQIDIDQFNAVYSLYFSSIALYELYLKDTQNAKKLINEDLFLPSALYSIPRKGRISVGITSPPLFDVNTKQLTLETVENPRDLKIKRSVGKNFYNSVVYKYNEDSVDDKLLNGNITISNNSIARIEAPNRPLKIDARGLRPSAATDLLIERNANRFLRRYEYGAESLDVNVPFGVGWTIEVGDSIVFGEPALQVSDSTQGNRQFQPRIFEVINKRMNWRTGAISLSILDTNFNQPVRYGTWAPSSVIGTGSNTDRIKITDSYGYGDSEFNKWEFYIGKQILIHNEDWSQQWVTTFNGFDPGDEYMMLIDFIPSIAAPGWGVTVPEYDLINVDSEIYKSLHPFWTPQLVVTGATSSTQFTVSALDAAKAFEGGVIRVHNYNYTTDSGEVPLSITSIVGTTINCEDLGYVPAIGDFVDLVGFVSDEGKPYCWI